MGHEKITHVILYGHIFVRINTYFLKSGKIYSQLWAEIIFSRWDYGVSHSVPHQHVFKDICMTVDSFYNGVNECITTLQNKYSLAYCDGILEWRYWAL